MGADAPEDQVEVVRDALLAVLDELASDGPTQEELDVEVNGFERQFEDRDATLGFLDACVLDILFGEEPRTAQAILDGRRAVGPEEAAETLRTSLAIAAGRGGWDALAAGASDAVPGLVAGPDRRA